MDARLLEELRGLIGDGAVSTGQSDLDLHSHDESTHDPVTPEVVVYPTSTEDVSAILQVADRERIPVTGYGAGTSLEGNAVPAPGAMVVDFRNMNQIVAVYEDDFQATVQPGVLRLDLEKHLADYGLFFPPDPGANASIGGMIANNAAGVRAIKYGATRDSVLALTAVLADGRVIKTGSRSVKQSAGYDLRHLIVGSEGTLALVTEATLKLAPVPEHFATALVAFPDVAAVTTAVHSIMGHGLEPAALEMLHAYDVAWMNEDEDTGFREEPSLMIEFTGASKAAVDEAMREALELCESAGAPADSSRLDRQGRAQLWRLRHGARERYVRRNPRSRHITIDVSVPMSTLPEMVGFAEKACADLGFDLPIFGHAGDGNIHIGIAHEPSNADAATKLSGRLVERALELGGTSTGEHGIGIGKRKYLVNEFGTEAVDVMRAIKRALDPNNILNPGKVLPD